MSTKPPSLPPVHRSDKGPGSAETAPNDPDKTGPAGNSTINTTHLGRQQDRWG